MRVDADRGHGRNALADVDHRAPFGEARALLVIFLQPLGEPVEADGHQFAGTLRQGLRAFIDLDAGDTAGLLDQLDQRGAVLCLLPDGLIIENDAGNVFRHRLLRAEQHLAIVAAIVLGGLHLDGLEPLPDGAGGFVGGEDALAGHHHGVGDLVEVGEIHESSSRR